MILCWTETACFPRMYTVAIGAQQPQVSLVRRPIFKSSVPRPDTIFGANLFFRVYMVNLKCANIAKAALNALPTQFFNERDLALPISGALVNPVPVFVPIVAAALVCAEPLLVFKTRFAALFALSVVPPSCLKVASLATVFTSAILNSIRVHLVRLAANGAGKFDWFLSHTDSISKCMLLSKPEYFDIACRRIDEAYKQPRLFAEPAPKPVQTNLLDGAA